MPIARAMIDARLASSSSPSESSRAWAMSTRIWRRSSASTAAVVRGVGRLDWGASVMRHLRSQKLQGCDVVFGRAEYAGAELRPAGSLDRLELTLDFCRRADQRDIDRVLSPFAIEHRAVRR
jgi:hypothetical protein